MAKKTKPSVKRGPSASRTGTVVVKPFAPSGSDLDWLNATSGKTSPTGSLANETTALLNTVNRAGTNRVDPKSGHGAQGVLSSLQEQLLKIAEFTGFTGDPKNLTTQQVAMRTGSQVEDDDGMVNTGSLAGVMNRLQKGIQKFSGLSNLYASNLARSKEQQRGIQSINNQIMTGAAAPRSSGTSIPKSSTPPPAAELTNQLSQLTGRKKTRLGGPFGV